MNGSRFARALFRVTALLIIGIFTFNTASMAGVVSFDHLRGRSANHTNQPLAMKSEFLGKDGGSLATGKFIVLSEGKGLIHYLPRMIQRMAINNGTAHGNNYDAEGNLIKTQMNLKMTGAIAEAIKAYGIQIVQHGVTGTPIENLQALRNVGIRAAHVGTNWQNIIWETLVAEAQNGDATAKSIVNRMIDATIAKTADVEKKYKVSPRSDEEKNSVYIAGKNKDLDKLLGKELKMVIGDFHKELLRLPAHIIEKIDAATEKSATEHMIGFGSDGTAQMVKDYYKANGLSYPDDFSSLKGYHVFKALEGTDKTIMCCNIRHPLSLPGIIRAAKKTGSIVIFQQAMSELDYTWPGGYSLDNVAKFAANTKAAAMKEGFRDYMNKSDHVTVKVDEAFLKDTGAQNAVAELFEKILAEKDIAKREAMFNSALKDEAFNAAPGVGKAMKAVNKAMLQVKKQVAEDHTVFALDASFMPTRLNVLVSAFLAGFIPEDAGLEAEVGEIGGKENSTVADAVEFITGIRYKEQVVTDRQGVKFSQLVGPKRIGVLTGGGPASGHNKVLAEMVREGLKNGIEIVAIPEGWAGLIKDDLVAQARAIRLSEAEKWEKKGGTFIKTSRTNPYKKEGDAQKVWENIKKLDLDGLVTLGGDDTNGVTAKLQKEHPEFLFIGLPKTMDNDIALPEPDAQTYGFDSFTRAATDAFEAGKVDAISTKRILIGEVFGRSAGFVAARIGANVGATRTLIPEEMVDLRKLVDDLRSYYKQNKYGVVVVAEGASIATDGFRLNDNGDLEVVKPRNADVKLLLAAFNSDPVAKAAFIKSMKAGVDDFGHPKLENAGLIVASVVKTALKEDKIDISLAGKADYLFRSADISKLDEEMTGMLGKAAVEKIADLQNNQLLYAYKGQIKSIPFDQELGGRQLDYKGAHRDEYLLANMALINEKTNLKLGKAAMNQLLYQSAVKRLYQLKPGEILSLGLDEMKAVLWKLNTIKKESGDNQEVMQSIRRILHRIDDRQLAQVKTLAGMGVFAKSNTPKKLDLALQDQNIVVIAANALIFRAGAFALFYKNWEPGVNLAALKSMKGGKEASAEEFVRMNSRYNGPFGPYQVKGMRVLKDERRVVDGVEVNFIFVPGDKNIGRPDIKIPYFGPETTNQQVLDTIRALGVKPDVVSYYGPTDEKVQPRIFKEFMEAGFPVVAASPVNTDAVKNMLKEKFIQEGVSADTVDKSVSAVFKEALYSAMRKQIGPDVKIVDTLSCTSNAMISVIKAMWDTFGIVNGTGLTIHSETDSNETFPMKSKRARDPLDIARGDSIRDNIIPASTGAKKNLFKMIPQLKGRFEITAVRTDTVSASLWEVTLNLKRETTVEEVRAALKDFALNKSDGVVKFYEGDPEVNMGPLDVNAVVGWNNVSIIDSVLIQVLENKKTVIIKGLYDNQSAAPNQMISKWSPWMVDGLRMRALVNGSYAKDGGASVALAQTETVLPEMVDIADLIETALKSDASVYNAGAMNFRDLVKSVSDIQNARGAVIVGANAIMENAGSIAALERAKDAAGVVDFSVWAKDDAAKLTLEALGVGRIATIHVGLKAALEAVTAAKIPQSRIALISADADMDNIEAEFTVSDASLFFEKAKVKNVRVTGSRAAVAQKRINAMPLVMAKALAMIFNTEDTVRQQLQNMAAAYMNKGLISSEDLLNITQLAAQLADVPLVSVSDEVAAMQTVYEDTLNKI